MVVIKHAFALGILFVVYSFNLNTFAQDRYKMNGPTKFEVSGTSSLKNWEMNSQKGSGTANIAVENGRINSIEKLSVTLRGESLKSGTSGMDKNAYNALKTGQHPVIRFKMEEVLSNRGNVIKIKGDLTVAGVTKTKTFDMQVNNSSESLRFSGKLDVTFDEFNMTPPTAMWGTIKTGNELTISFNAVFKPIS